MTDPVLDALRDLREEQRNTGEKVVQLSGEVKSLKATFEERTKDMATLSDVDAKLEKHTAHCLGKRYDREATQPKLPSKPPKPSTPPAPLPKPPDRFSWAIVAKIVVATLAAGATVIGAIVAANGF